MSRHVLSHPAWRHALRLLAALPGAYAVSAALVALMGSAFALLGLSRSDSVVLAAMLGFVAYLLLLLWVFAQRSLRRVFWVIAIGSAAGAGSLWLIARG